MLADGIEVPQDQVEALYQQRIDQFVQPERRLVERLVFPDTEAAQAAADRIAAGETDFDTLVEDRGLSLSDVDLGDVGRDELGAAGEAVFTAESGSVAGPVETSLGPALFRVNAVIAAEETTLDEAAPALRQELATDQARRAIRSSAETVNDLIAGGATLADLADRTDLELNTISLAPNDTDGPAAYDSFREAAMAATEGAYPELMELDDGGIFALRLDGITPPEVEPFEAVRDRVETAWRTAAQRRAIRARAEALAGEVQPMTSLDSLGLAPRDERNLTRGAFVDGTPANFMATVFAMSPGEARALETEDGALVVRLDRVTEADREADLTSAQAEAITAQANEGIAADIYGAYAEAIRRRTDVVIDEAAVNAVNAQMN